MINNFPIRDCVCIPYVPIILHAQPIICPCFNCAPTNNSIGYSVLVLRCVDFFRVRRCVFTYLPSHFDFIHFLCTCYGNLIYKQKTFKNDLYCILYFRLLCGLLRWFSNDMTQHVDLKCFCTFNNTSHSVVKQSDLAQPVLLSPVPELLISFFICTSICYVFSE
jgi:hypothetical protein